MSAVFITGAQSGTGYGIAELFAKNGWDVFITSRTGAKAEKAAADLAAKYGVFAKGYECTIGSEQQIIDIFRDIDLSGKFVETVVLNAANMGFDPKDPAAGQDFWTVPVEDFRCVFETNLVWNFTIVRQAALRMRERGKGSVVYLSSNTAYRAIPHRAAYSASKGGVIALTKTTAKEFAGRGVRYNAVAPGFIQTAMTDKLPDKVKEQMKAFIPLGHFGLPEDIAKTVNFLASDEAAYITGQVITVDGGMVM